MTERELVNSDEARIERSRPVAATVSTLVGRGAAA